jgi:preprotein translocase subunit YajC
MFDFRSMGFLLAQQGTPQASPSPLFQWLPLVFLVLIVYFLMIRPIRQREKRHREFLTGLKPGDKVVTQGGLHGTVVSVGERTVQVRIADGVKVEVTKSAVAGQVPAEGEGK